MKVPSAVSARGRSIIASQRSNSKTRAFQAAYRTVIRYYATVVKTVTTCSVPGNEQFVSLGCKDSFSLQIVP